MKLLMRTIIVTSLNPINPSLSFDTTTITSYNASTDYASKRHIMYLDSNTALCMTTEEAEHAIKILQDSVDRLHAAKYGNGGS